MAEDKNKSASFKSGFVAIIGRPNVGKSTLLNALLGNKISIVSNIPQTTRFQVKGILDFDNAQIVFIDTPGIHLFKDDLAHHLNKVAKKSVEGIEGILYVVDVSRPPGEEEKNIMKFIIKASVPVVIAFNKIDLSDRYKDDYLEMWNQLLKESGKENPVKGLVSISALKGKNLDELKRKLLKILPEGPVYYEKGTATDFPIKFRVSDIIREKLLHYLKEELPHSVAVEVERIENKSNIVYIKSTIHVLRDSQKKIVIGTQGNLLKKVGQSARKELEYIFGKKVYLELFVKVTKDWQKSPRILKELGYWWI